MALIMLLLSGFIYMCGGLTLVDILPNLATDLFIIAITILLIDTIYKKQSDLEVKKVLIAQLGSNNAIISTKALLELRARNWLYDGSLQKAFLLKADISDGSFDFGDLRKVILDFAILQRTEWTNSNLERAFMTFADLRGAEFKPRDEEDLSLPAKMNGVSLHFANLLGASISTDQLKVVNSLWRAIMPDGQRYDGRYNLQGDIDIYTKYSSNTPTSGELAKFYGVAEEIYLQGQRG